MKGSSESLGNEEGALPSTTTSSSTSLRSAIMSAAEEMVSKIVCTAKARIDSDPHGLFYYKKPYPGVFNIGSTSEIIPADTTFSQKDNLSHKSGDTMSTTRMLPWTTIMDFDPILIPNLLTEFVDTWELSPNTKYIIEYKAQPIELSHKGTYYDCVVYFNKPTEDCPNPLVRAKVHFRLSVPILLPKYYEIMVTYRFEGFRTLYYALGEKALNSCSFQRFFIDSIMEMKLAFYSEVYYCTHPDNCPNCKPLFRRTCEVNLE